MTFDLEKARAVCKTLPKYMNGACPCKEEAEAAKMLIKALPEIRRLQEFRDRVARILKQPLTDCDDLLILGLDARICQLRRQAAEIERLRAEISEQKGMIWKTQQVKKEQAAQIKELEEAKSRSWQITGDRITAIDQGLRFLEWSNAKTGNVETKKRIAILKTMLEEASDEHGFER